MIKRTVIKKIRKRGFVDADFLQLDGDHTDDYDTCSDEMIYSFLCLVLLSFPDSKNRTEASIRVSRMFKSHVRPTIW
jgi:hypothetical protein